MTANNVTLTNGVTYQSFQCFSAQDIWENFPRSQFCYRCTDADGSNRCYAESFHAAKELCSDRIVKIDRFGNVVAKFVRGVNTRGQFFRKA